MSEDLTDPNDRVAKITRTVERARELRQEATFPERLLWGRLRQRPCGLKFRRQHRIGEFIADFCCLESMVVVEIDGRSHIGTERQDMSREQVIESFGFSVIRFTNDHVLDDLNDVVRCIVRRCTETRSDLPSPDSAENG